MSYKYVDLGCYNGDTILQFYQHRNLPAPQDDFQIYAFDPNPLFKPIWEKLTKAFPNVNFSNKAAYTDNKVRKFTIDTNYLAYGSTLEESKVNWGVGEIVEAECFDFSEWVKQFKDDYLIVKMDIEGAEFPILEKMLKNDTVKYMNQLWVEVHPNKVREYTTTYSYELIEKVRKHTEVTLWH